MLVVVFPLSYLVMNIIASNGKISIIQTVIGAYTSMIISLFFNLFAIQVSSANEIQILERVIGWRKGKASEANRHWHPLYGRSNEAWPWI